MSKKISETVHLEWENKKNEKSKLGDDLIIESEKIYPRPLSGKQALLHVAENDLSENIKNRYYYGDNLLVLQSLLNEGMEGKLDLIYIDPPYMSELAYRSTITTGNDRAERINRLAFQDKWDQGLDSYLDMLYPRLKLMYRLLSEQGSIFVHSDWHVSHYLKIVLDEIFGREHFINEIIWCYGGGSRSRNHFQRKHDVIFWYSKGADYIFHPQYRPYSEGTLKRGLTRVKGDRYSLNEEGAILQDWWTDINKILSPTARENLKYPTQKPIELIKRLLATASNDNSLVADFFAGSATLAEAANQMNRNWILADNGRLAQQTAIYRLLKTESPAFTISTEKGNRLEPSDRLKLKKPKVHFYDDNRNIIEIAIEHYHPDNKEGHTEDFSSCIEFWEIDLDYDKKIFESNYQIMRENNRFTGPISLDFTCYVPKRDNYTIAVKVYDIYTGQALQFIELDKPC